MKKLEKKINLVQNLKILYDKKQNILKVVSPFGEKKIKILENVKISKIQNFLILEYYSKTKQNSKDFVYFFKRLEHLFFNSIFGYSETIFFDKIGYTFEIGRLNTKKKDLLLLLNLGYSHPIYLKVPKNIFLIKEDKTTLKIIGACNQLVSNFAVKIVSLKKFDIYKNKGLKLESKLHKLKQKQNKKT